MLSIPSKLMESYVASNITNHVVTQNLLDNRQWTYRKGKSTEQLLIHLTGRWREAVGILFVDFTKAFNSVPQYIATKAERPWNERRYLAVVKELPYRSDSDTHIIVHLVWQLSVLGPTLFSSFKRPPKITTLCGNLSVCRRHNNILSQKQWIC